MNRDSKPMGGPGAPSPEPPPEEPASLWRLALESMVDGIIVIDAEGMIQLANPAAAEMFGYRADELVGRTVNTLMPEPDRSRHDGYVRRYLDSSRGHILGYPRDVTGLRRDGTTFPLSLAVSEMSCAGRARFTGVLRDMTKPRRSAATQHLVHALYSQSAMLISDADNHIITVNEPFIRLTGYELHEILGENPKLLASGRHGREFYEAMWRALNTAGNWQGQIWNRRKNGQEYLESLSISLIYDDTGDVFRHVAMFSDITASDPDHPN